MAAASLSAGMCCSTKWLDSWSRTSRAAAVAFGFGFAFGYAFGNTAVV